MKEAIKHSQTGLKKLFFAIMPASNQQQGLIDIVKPLASSFTETARWVVPDNLHMTLNYLGLMEPEKVHAIVQQVKNHLTDVSAFEVISTKLGFLPARHPRALVLHMQLNTALAQCFYAINQGVLAQGCDIEKRAYMPHISLAHSDVFNADQFLPHIESFAWVVNEVVLFESVMLQGCSSYVPMARLPLLSSVSDS